MRSQCTAASPQFISSYAWKEPLQRPELFERAERLIARAREHGREASKAEHPSIPWKAYLASREFQNLASDLAEALFSPPPSAVPQATSRPLSLRLDAGTFPWLGVKPLSGLLAPALPDGTSPSANRSEADRGQPSLAKAA
jgi:hypothetical protein